MNGGTPKSSISMGFPTYSKPSSYWGSPILGNLPGGMVNKTAVELRLFKGLHGHTRPQYGCEIGSRTEKHVIIINYIYIYIMVNYGIIDYYRLV